MIRTAHLQRADAQMSSQPPGRSQKGRAAALALPCFGGSKTQTAVPAVSERRLLGAEGDKPGLSSRTRRAWLCVFQAREGPAPPPTRGCSLVEAAAWKGALLT